MFTSLFAAALIAGSPADVSTTEPKLTVVSGYYGSYTIPYWFQGCQCHNGCLTVGSRPSPYNAVHHPPAKVVPEAPKKK